MPDLTTKPFHILLIVFIIFSAVFKTKSQTPELIWVKQGVGGTSLKVDHSGNVYVPGIPVAKLDSMGNIIWKKDFGNQSGINMRSIDVDKYGNVYTTGSFYGTVDFDPNNSIYNLLSERGGIGRAHV